VIIINYYWGELILLVHEENTVCFAFHRVISFYPTDGESWANLGTVYIKQNKLKEAFLALKEALRHRRESWQMWDNFLLICLKLGKLQDAIQALHNLLELRDKYIDIEALNYLVELVIADTSHSQSLEGVKIHVQLAELMDKITSKVSVNPELWAIYAKYWIAFNDIEKAVDFRVKQCRSLQTVGWERDASLFKKLIPALQELATTSFKIQSKEVLYSVKLFLKGALNKAKPNFEGTPEFNTLQDCVQQIEELEKKFIAV